MVLRIAAILGLAVVSGQPAFGGPVDFNNGSWRVEVSGLAGTHSGRTNREGDFLTLASIEYEMPAYKRATFGIRFFPLFLLNENREDGEDDHSIYGAGLGVAARIYQHEGDRNGFFLEAGATPIVHSDEWERNSSQFNFLTGLGVGYKFRTHPWHISLSVQHVSNAGLGDKNAGINAVGLSAGFTF